MYDMIEIKGVRGLVDKAKVYNIESAIRASKLPMAVDVKKPDSDITDKVNSLARADSGSGEDNFLSGILATFDLTFTVKAWTEFQRYHFIQIVSSQSSMHRIEKFVLPDQFIGYVDDEIVEHIQFLQEDYLKSPDPEKRLKLLYSCPVGLKLTAHITTNYRQLKTIYRQRHNHKLPEWRAFCEWIDRELPHSEWLTGKVAEKEDGLL